MALLESAKSLSLLQHPSSYPLYCLQISEMAVLESAKSPSLLQHPSSNPLYCLQTSTRNANVLCGTMRVFFKTMRIARRLRKRNFPVTNVRSRQYDLAT